MGAKYLKKTAIGCLLDAIRDLGGDGTEGAPGAWAAWIAVAHYCAPIIAAHDRARTEVQAIDRHRAIGDRWKAIEARIVADLKLGDVVALAGPQAAAPFPHYAEIIGALDGVLAFIRDESPSLPAAFDADAMVRATATVRLAAHAAAQSAEEMACAVAIHRRDVRRRDDRRRGRNEGDEIATENVSDERFYLSIFGERHAILQSVTQIRCAIASAQRWEHEASKARPGALLHETTRTGAPRKRQRGTRRTGPPRSLPLLLALLAAPRQFPDDNENGARANEASIPWLLVAAALAETGRESGPWGAIYDRVERAHRRLKEDQAAFPTH